VVLNINLSRKGWSIRRCPFKTERDIHTNTCTNENTEMQKKQATLQRIITLQ
jgi:hypothetical protein